MTSGTTQKWVYDFSEGNKDQKDLLGGKGANLAEMTNLGLPVPPGLHHHHRGLPVLPRARQRPRRSWRDEVERAPRRAREGDGQDARRRRRPAAGLGALRRQVLHARDDGDRPQRRPQRRVGAGPGRAGRQRALRLGLLPPADPDVRQDRAATSTASTSRRPSTRPSASRAPTNDLDLDAERPARTSSTRFKAHRARADRPRLPAGPARADGPGRSTRSSTRGTPSAPILYRRQERIPGRPRHRGQRRARWSSATSAWTPAPASPSPATRAAARRASTATTCRTPRARTSSPASATPCRSPSWSSIDKGAYDELHGDHGARWRRHYRDLCDIEFTIERSKLWMLQTRVGKRTAGAAFLIATQLVDEGLIDMDEARAAGHRRPAGAADVPALRATAATPSSSTTGHERLARRRRRQGRLRLRDRGRVGRPGREGHPGPPGDQPRRPRPA